MTIKHQTSKAEIKKQISRMHSLHQATLQEASPLPIAKSYSFIPFWTFQSV